MAKLTFPAPNVPESPKTVSFDDAEVIREVDEVRFTMAPVPSRTACIRLALLQWAIRNEPRNHREAIKARAHMNAAAAVKNGGPDDAE